MSPQLCVQRRGCLRTDPWVGDRRRGESPFAKGGPDPQQAVFSVSEAALHSLPGITGGSLSWEREFGGLSCNHTGAVRGVSSRSVGKGGGSHAPRAWSPSPEESGCTAEETASSPASLLAPALARLFPSPTPTPPPASCQCSPPHTKVPAPCSTDAAPSCSAAGPCVTKEDVMPRCSRRL